MKSVNSFELNLVWMQKFFFFEQFFNRNFAIPSKVFEFVKLSNSLSLGTHKCWLKYVLKNAVPAVRIKKLLIYTLFIWRKSHKKISTHKNSQAVHDERLTTYFMNTIGINKYFFAYHNNPNNRLIFLFSLSFCVIH